MNSTTPPVSDERWRISTLPAYKIESYDNMKEKLQKNSIEIEIIRAECETLKGDLEEKDHQLRRARGARNGSKSPNRVALSPRPPRTPPVETSFESHYTNNEPRRQTMGVPSNARTNTNQRAPIQQMDLLQMIYSQATQMEDNIREIDSQCEINHSMGGINYIVARNKVATLTKTSEGAILKLRSCPKFVIMSRLVFA